MEEKGLSLLDIMGSNLRPLNATRLWICWRYLPHRSSSGFHRLQCRTWSYPIKLGPKRI